MFNIKTISPEEPVLIAGPTASGKSALALQIAAAQGGVILNADALQVFGGWQILTARPSPADLAEAEHRLYGHIAFDAPYSTGHWLRDIAAELTKGQRPIIVGGTGLYFMALTEGLAEIPATPPEVREAADQLELEEMIEALDPESRAKIDLLNRARVQRAYEVLRATGKGIAAWQADTPAPLLPAQNAKALVMLPDVAWLNARIEKRFDMMLKAGALDEARAMHATWDPAYLSSKAIGAPELIGHLDGLWSLEEARERSIIASRQYAKRQRTWFRARMKSWQPVTLGEV